MSKERIMASEQRTPPYWTIGLYVILTVAVAAVLARGWHLGDSTLILLGGLGLVIAITMAPIGIRLARPSGGAATDMEGLIRSFEHLAEQQALSDDARRVLNRSRERDLLRKAIEEDITNEDWDAAMVLVKELAERFGYRTDAEGFRTRIETAQYQTVEKRVDEAIHKLDAMIVQLRWDEATFEAARIGRLYPDSPRVEGLRHRVAQARDRYKRELERRFLKSAEQGQVDDAMELLKELDQYLSESEAEPYREVAKGVIGQARENLGVQFKLAVQDRQWHIAAAVGDRIIKEFPNSRMAQEIREIIDSIRERASGVASG
jgi:tetratricopeptide (TPR) repeat protein